MSPRLTLLMTRSAATPVLLALAMILLLAVLGIAARMVADPLIRSLPTPMLPSLALALVTPLLSVALPLGFFAGLVAAITRLDGDGTVEAALCLGATPTQIALPSLLLALTVAALTFVAGAWGEPWGRHAARHQIAQLSGPDLHLREGALSISIDGVTLGASSVGGDGSLREVMLWARDGDEVAMAPRGSITLENGCLVADLYDGELHVAVADGYARARFDSYRVELPLPVLQIRGHEPFELAPGALLGAIEERRQDGREVRFHLLALHRRLAIPLAAPLLALLAWPLGRTRSGHTVTRGVLLAVAIGLGYYLLLRVGDHGLRALHWPPALAAWLATGLLAPAAALGWMRRWAR